jgi:hypothetical protein
LRQGSTELGIAGNGVLILAAIKTCKRPYICSRFMRWARVR